MSLDHAYLLTNEIAPLNGKFQIKEGTRHISGGAAVDRSYAVNLRWSLQCNGQPIFMEFR